jgi:hypothetical protein
MLGSVLLSVFTLGSAQSPPPPVADEHEQPPVTLPNLVVRDRMPSSFTPADIAPAGLAAGEPPLELFFPGSAYTAGVSKGIATVGILLGADGNPIDFLVLAYTQPYFGEALLSKARKTKFVALRAKGVAVPSRYELGYTFYPDPSVPVVMDVSTALSQRIDRISGKPQFLYMPHRADELDQPLQPTHSAVPLLPTGYEQDSNKVVQVVASFYVDEAGSLRLPSVDATPSPLLVRNAVAALLQWRFQPPTIRGQPVLVYTNALLTFERGGL